MGRRIVGPDGRGWVVRRRWAPRLGSETLLGRFRGFALGVLRKRRKLGDHADGIVEWGCLVDELGLVIGAALLVLAVVLVLLFGVVVPVLLALVDVVGVLLIAGLGLLARVALGRPWTIEARADGTGAVRTWKVVGWRASRERLDEIGRQLAAGLDPAPG